MTATQFKLLKHQSLLTTVLQDYTHPHSDIPPAYSAQIMASHYGQNYQTVHIYDEIQHIDIERSKYTLKLQIYTPISIKVASEKNDAWSKFHSPQCIIVASLVNYVPATNLET